MLDFSTVRKKIHSPEEGEQLGLPLDFSTIREGSAPKIIDPPTIIPDSPVVPDHIQFPGNPYEQVAPAEPPPPKIKEFIPSVQKGWGGLQAGLGQLSLDQRELNKKRPYLALFKAFFSHYLGGHEQAGFFDEKKAAEITKKVEDWNQYSESKGELMTTDDINGFGDFIDYFQTMLGSSTPQMGLSILSGGTFTPMMMTAELNSNLKGIEGLSLEDRMALSHGGGLISAALENLGLGFIIRGIPKEVIGKIGIKKFSNLLEKSVLAKSGAKITANTLAGMGIEGSTEGLQEAVALAAEGLGGRDFKPGEITYRLKQAIAAGATVGGGISTATSVPRVALDARAKPEPEPEKETIRGYEVSTLDFSTIREEPSDVEVAQTQEAEDAFDEYLPGKREKNYDKFWERRTFESKPPKQEEQFKIEEKAVPEESLTEQSTPVQEEAVSPTQTGQPTINKDVKSPDYVLNAKPEAKKAEDEARLDQGRVVDLNDEEINTQLKIGRRVLKDIKEKELELDPTPIKEDIKALQNEKKRRKNIGKELPPDLPPEGEDTTEQVGTVEDASVVAKEETTPVKEVKVEEKTDVKTKPKKKTKDVKKETKEEVTLVEKPEDVEQAELIKEQEKDTIGIEAGEDIGKPIHYTEVDRDWPDVELERRDEEVTVAFLEEHGYEETDTGREENTFQILGDGKIIAYTPISDPKSIRKKVEQKTFNNPSLKELRDWMGYSEGEVKKGTTVDKVKSEIESSFGKKTVRKLTKNDGITILATQKELEAEIKTDPSMEGRKVAGAFDPNTGKVYLVAENIDEGKAPGVLLHEVGEHAALNDMLGDVQYEALSKNFNELVKAKDPIALAAQKKVPKKTPPSRRKSEELAYLVQEVQNQLSAGEKVPSKARTLYNRVVNLIRNWLKKLPAYRKFEGRAALKRLQKGELLTPENIASLARVAVDFHTETDKKSFKKGFVKFSEEGKRITTTEEAEAWKADNKRPERKKARIDSPELRQAAEDLEAGEITFDEYQELADKIAPIKKFDKVPEPATNLEIAGSIDRGQLRDGGLLGEDGIVKDEENVELRLDIPAYEDFDTWVATIYHGGKKIYGATAKILNVTFKTQPLGALKIAKGKQKTPLATMKGEWVNATNEELKAEAEGLMNDPNWIQIGMNPERQSSFYAKEDKTINGEVIKKGTPLASAEEVIQIGALVLAKKPSTQEAPVVPSASKKAGKEIRFSEAETEAPTTGININDSKQPFTKQIISGEKTIETRNTNSLKAQVGKRVGIIRTGKGKARVVAYATIGEPIVYNNKEEFRKDQDKHLVEEGSEFDIKEDGLKYGYPLLDVKKVDRPFLVKSKGIVSREIDQPPKKAEIEVDMDEKIDESEFTEVEKRFEEAKIKTKETPALETIKEVAERAKNIFTRSHPDLDPKKFGQTLEYLREVQNVAPYAQWQTFQDIYSFVDQMTDDELQIFTYNVILPDMVKDLDSGLLTPKDGELPFGYENADQVKRHLRLMQQKAQKTKTKSGKTVAEAVTERNKIMNNLKEELIDEGLLSEELRDDDSYYHHQVIQFMEMKDKFKGDFNVNQKTAGVRVKKEGWQRARTGTTKDYNTNYLDAEFSVMSMMRAQLETKKILDKIKAEEDQSSKIKAQAREEGTTVEKLLRDSKEWENYTVWKPNPDSVWRHVYTVNDQIVQQVQDEVKRADAKIWENKQALEKGEKLPKRTQKEGRGEPVEITEEDIGEGVIKGEDEQWIIPKELAKTLNESKRKNEGIMAVSAWSLSAWKKWMLLNPERLIKYNLNNTSGDIDIAFAFDPKILLETKSALFDLLKDQKKKKLSDELKAELADARKRGVIDSGFSIVEVDDFSKMYDKLFNARPSNMKDETWVQGIEAVVEDVKTAPKKLAKGYWKTAKEYTTLRENILRLATYRYLKKRMNANPDEKIYAASKSYEIDQLKSPDEKAAKMARELIGDYGNISHAGQWIREHLIPFWSWVEINSPRYVRLLANSAKETSGNRRAVAKRIAQVIPGKVARKGVSVGIYGGVKLYQFALFTTLVGLYNATFFPEEEEKLSEFERGQLHIFLPNLFGDGRVYSLRMQGAFSDALSWLSLHDVFADYAQGKTAAEQIKEMAEAPVQKLVAGFTPFPKLFYETLAGKAFWPDVFNPRPTRDRWQHIAKAFSMGTVYDVLTGKPSKGWGNRLSKLLFASSDPGESAYYKLRGKVMDYNDKIGIVSGGGFTPTDKGNALYYFKQSMRYGDMEAAEKYLRDYFRLSDSPKKAMKGLKSSLKRVAPLGGLRKKDQKAFLNTLSDAEIKTLKVARDWYKEVYQ